LNLSTLLRWLGPVAAAQPRRRRTVAEALNRFYSIDLDCRELV
jgi:hypothetical protein